MTDWLRLCVVMVAVVNPARLWTALPDDTRPARVRATALAAALVLAFLLGAAALSGPLLDALDVSAPTWRIATGLIVAGAGARDLVWRPPLGEPALEGWRVALVPLAFPLLASPQLTLLALSSGADHGVLEAATAAAVGLGLVVAASTYRSRDRATVRTLVAAGRVVGSLAVAVGLGLVVDGVFSV